MTTNKKEQRRYCYYWIP